MFFLLTLGCHDYMPNELCTPETQDIADDADPGIGMTIEAAVAAASLGPVVVSIIGTPKNLDDFEGLPEAMSTESTGEIQVTRTDDVAHYQPADDGACHKSYAEMTAAVDILLTADDGSIALDQEGTIVVDDYALDLPALWTDVAPAAFGAAWPTWIDAAAAPAVTKGCDISYQTLRAAGGVQMWVDATCENGNAGMAVLDVTWVAAE